jgi:MFS family permease
MTGYLDLFRLPGARTAAIPALGARLAGTMTGLAVLLVALDAGRGYAVAGGVSAGYAGGYAIGAPLLGRLMDRFGTAPVIRTAGVLAGAVLVGLALAARRGVPAALVGSAALAGLLTPPVGAAMRALWVRLTSDPGLLRRAYALEATTSEALFIAGPACLTAVAAIDARAGVVVAAVLLTGGCVGFAGAPVVRRGRASRSVPVPGTRPTAAMVVVLGGVLATAAATGALTIALAAALRAQHVSAAYTGALIALQAAASVVGGLVSGTRSDDRGVYRRYLRLVLAMTVTLAPLPAAVLAYRAGAPAWASVSMLCLLLAISGVPIAPTGAAEFQLVGDLTPPERMTGAFAAVGSVIALGEAGGAAVAGVLAELVGPVATLLVPAACAAGALIVAVAGGRAILTAVPEPLVGRRSAGGQRPGRRRRR